MVRENLLQQMLDELEKIENLNFISFEVKSKAKAELLRNITAYEKGLKNGRKQNSAGNLTRGE